MTNTYTVVQDNLLQDKKLNIVDAVVYSKIESIAKTSGNNNVHMSNDWLSQMLGTSSSTISRSITKLDKLGYINVKLERKNAKTIRLIEIKTINQAQIKRKYEQSEYIIFLEVINFHFRTSYKKFNDQQLNVIDQFDKEQITKAIFTASTIDYYKNECNDKRTIFKSVEQVETLLGGK